MTRDVEKEANEFADYALAFHWQVRVKAEKENRAPFGQLTTVKDCYAHGYLAGAKAERRWWAEKWRKYSRLCQLPKDMSQQEIYKGRSAIIDELDQAAGEIE